MDFQQWLGNGVPPVTVRGLDHSTEEYARYPATQDRDYPLLDNPEWDHPAVGISNRTTKPK